MYMYIYVPLAEELSAVENLHINKHICICIFICMHTYCIHIYTYSDIYIRVCISTCRKGTEQGRET